MSVHAARALVTVVGLAACGDSTGRLPDAPPSTDDAPAIDAPARDAPVADAALDAPPRSYDCGTFTGDPGWTLSAGFRAVVVADAADGLNQPVSLVVAGGAFGGLLYVVNQGDDTLRSIDPDTGATATVVAATAWPRTPALLTASVWDAASVFDGALYIGDQGGDGDGDSVIFRVAPNGSATEFVAAPGPGLDDVYGLAFSTGGAYGVALYVTGDTDGAGVDWGRFDATATATAFSEVAGAEGIAFDTGGAYGGGLYAARPAGGGYAGDDTIGPIGADGLAGTPLVSARPGVHGIAFAPAGPFSALLHAASWQTGELFSVTPQGVVANLASGLQLTNYGSNMLAFSPDGRVLYVADRAANRVVCIEPI